MAAYLMAHDLGTSSHKCSIFDAEGRLVAGATAVYPTQIRSGGEAEQQPADWWDAVVRTSRQVLERVDAGSIQAVAFGAHMMGVVPVGSGGEVLHPALIHADTRSASLEAGMFERIGEQQLYGITGNRIDSHYPLPKLLWLRENRPEVFRRTAYFIQAKDYLVFRMTGRLGTTDYSDASLTGLFDIGACGWADGILDEFAVPKGRLPDILPSSAIAGSVTAEAAAATGLLAGTPVVIGGGDGSCAALGAGAVRTGDAYIYLGTTAWVSRTAAEPVIDEKRRVFNMCGPDAHSYNVLGTMQTAGAAYEWAVRSFAAKELADFEAGRGSGESPYEAVEQELRKLPWGANGLVFHPYLMGERSPLWDKDARGTFFGLGIGHTRFDMLRAVMEGISYGLRSIAEVLEQSAAIDRYTVIGGGMRSAVWRSVLSAVLGKPIDVPSQTGEATSLGAAMSAGIAAGMYTGYGDAAAKLRRDMQVTLPDAEGSKVYEEGYRLYNRLYEVLKDEYGALERLRT
ncbi:FGGY-family carbohydrate kinase [Paenibacillus alkaliterrae]|uniref:xylulokinase n=1 Tax=Paenibacillus alkaliterrae TaxID=320909 RepID=UPI001F3BFB27|nr:FGGY-family carbohydrate kinase [Paenibacillus alkaliterrae]MCF2939485.1 FGGY-family carbohydrate kinase [Paenibacillus alkaliterrae]